MLSDRRKAAIGYATYVVGRQAAKTLVRRHARTFLAAPPQKPRRRKGRIIVPLVGGAAGALAGAAVLAARDRSPAGNG